jgi:hypothetical protein
MQRRINPIIGLNTSMMLSSVLSTGCKHAKRKRKQRRKPAKYSISRK